MGSFDVVVVVVWHKWHKLVVTCGVVALLGEPLPLQDLKWLLIQLHRSLGGAIHPDDEKAWQRVASTFEVRNCSFFQSICA